MFPRSKMMFCLANNLKYSNIQVNTEKKQQNPSLEGEMFGIFMW